MTDRRLSMVAMTLLLVAVSSTMAENRPYSNRGFGFTAQIPDDWRVHAERLDGNRFIVGFGLPKVWSQLEQQEIENAVSITAYRRDDLGTLSDLLALDAERVADVLVSREEVDSNLGAAFVEVTKHGDLEYRTFKTCHFANEIGYVIAFTATEGTYEHNLPRYLEFLAGISFVTPTPEDEGDDSPDPELASAESYYEQARTLYDEGPSRAAEIIQLLHTAISVDEAHEKSIRLLGITYFGTHQSEKALVQFDRSIDLAFERDEIPPSMLMYKARALHDLGRDGEARKILEVFWALWQGDKKLEALYEYLYPLVKDADLPSD